MLGDLELGDDITINRWRVEAARFMMLSLSCCVLKISKTARRKTQDNKNPKTKELVFSWLGMRFHKHPKRVVLDDLIESVQVWPDQFHRLTFLCLRVSVFT